MQPGQEQFDRFGNPAERSDYIPPVDQEPYVVGTVSTPRLAAKIGPHATMGDV